MKEELSLVRKLLETGHLNVLERASLPFGKVRASVARELIIQELSQFGWFPHRAALNRGDAGGEHLQIELCPDNSIVFHRNTEISYLRFTHSTRKFDNLNEAILHFLHLREAEDLDGLAVYWDL